MLRQRPDHTLTEYVHLLRKSFDDYNETCEMIDGSAAIHILRLGLLMMRGISSTGQFGQAKQRVINAFDTNYLMSTNEMMGTTLHVVQNMEEEPPGIDLPTLVGTAPPISTFVAVGRSFHGGRGHPGRSSRSGRGLPNK
jgi:hypothetical protein